MKKVISIIAICLILTMMTALLVACVPANADKAKEKLSKAGYKVNIASALEIATVETMSGLEGIQEGISANNSDTKGNVVAYLFDSQENAKKGKEKARELFGEPSDAVIEVKGKWLIAGNKEGYNAFTK
jgi:ABC-type oligopeptide transport system substrate-binding subunit